MPKPPGAVVTMAQPSQHPAGPPGRSPIFSAPPAPPAPDFRIG